jgi:poly-gamma-glutamate synthesis protein (capsule biosynthesis protein)
MPILPLGRSLGLASAFLLLVLPGPAGSADEAGQDSGSPGPAEKTETATAGLGPQSSGETAEVSLLAGGDVVLGYHLPEFFDELRRRGTVSEKDLRRYPFQEIASVTRAADLFLVNYEATLTRSSEAVPKNFNFRAAPEDVAILQAAGVDLVSLANNHAYDFGEAGLAETLSTLGRAGIAVFGAGRDIQEARQPAILQRGGLWFGFLGYLFMGDHSIEPPDIYAGVGKAGVAGTHKDLATLAGWVRTDTEDLRGRVDVVVVSFHWGREGSNLTQPYQRHLARVAAGAGADVVLGHHSHTLQGYERLDGTLVAYSLGNLVFAGNWNPTRKEAALLEIRFSTGDAVRESLDFDFLPISVDRQPGFPFQPYFLEEPRAGAVREALACYLGATEEGECEAAGEQESPPDSGTAGERATNP